MPTEQFYDELVSFYDLVYPDWEASMARQGDALARCLRDELPPGVRDEARVLDAAAGIGTQALPLAGRGFDVTARDLSSQAIARLVREANARGLQIDAHVADMRAISETVVAPFEAVVCCDNSLPHLLTDSDIATALTQFWQVLAPGGVCVCSVRDYDGIERGVAARHDYGERRRDDRIFRLWQEWRWLGETHYDVTFVVEEATAAGPVERVRTETRYYAIGIPRLLRLMQDAGFTSCRRIDGVFYQPLLVGRRATSTP